jgi:sec-independent protein translocase protein TatC
MGENPKSEGVMTILEHLGELQSRVWRMAVVYLAMTAVCFAFAYPLMKDILTAPLDSLDPETTNVIAKHNPALGLMRKYAGLASLQPPKLSALSVTEVFMVKFKMAMLGGLILSAPYLFYQMWGFIGTGLLVRERRVVLKYLPFSLGLFALGMAFAYLAIFPSALLFLLTVDRSVELVLAYSSYFELVVMTLAIFGLAFQLPLVMMAVARIGLVSPKSFAGKRRIAIVVIFVASAIIVPSPDPFSMCLLAIPLVGLYELGLWLARAAQRTREKRLAESK